MDRLVKRAEGVAADHARIAASLSSLTETSADTYATDTNEIPLLNDGLLAMSKHLKTAQTLLEDESRGWDEGVLEDLKQQRDALVSVRELFERRERLDKDNIPYLERRIQANETKLAGLRAKPDGAVKPGEIEKVAESIIKVCRPKKEYSFSLSLILLSALILWSTLSCLASRCVEHLVVVPPPQPAARLYHAQVAKDCFQGGQPPEHIRAAGGPTHVLNGACLQSRWPSMRSRLAVEASSPRSPSALHALANVFFSLCF